jgi:predicted exporter
MSITPRAAIAAWIVAVLIGVGVIARTQFSADMSAFLPRSPSPAQQVLVDQMQNGAASRLLLLALENAPTAILADLSGELTKRLRQDNAFALTNNGAEQGAEAPGLPSDSDVLWRNRYLLSPGVTPEKFTVAGLQQTFATDLELLGSDLAGVVKQSLPADPTGEILTLINQFAGQSQPSHRDGVWFSRDGRRALLLVQTSAAGFDISGQEQALAALDSAFGQARNAISGADGARLLVTGPAVFAVHTKTEMKEDISRLSLVGTILVSAILLFAYRSPRLLVLALVPVASGALAGVAAVSLGFGFVHGITLGFGVTLIGEAVDYAIYLFTQTAPGTSPAATLPRIWPMLQLGVLVSVCGFSAMLFSSFTGFAQLGLFSITGLLVAVAVARWVLPSLLPGNFGATQAAVFAPKLLGVARRAHFLRVPALLVLLGAGVLLALHHGSFWEDDLASLSPIPATDQKLDQDMRSDIGAPDVRYLIVVTARDEQQALVASERLAVALQDLAGQGVIAGFDAPSRYLPSAATQRARLAALPDPVVLHERLVTALEDSDFRPEYFEPFVAAIAAAKGQPVLDRAALQGTSLALKVDSSLFERKGVWTALLSLRGVADARRVALSVGEIGGDGATFLDLKAESDRLLGVYRREALMLALVGSLVIVLLLAITLRSPRRVLLIVMPLAAAVILTTAVLTLGSQKLSIFNLVGLLLTVAVGSNYCIFFERQDWTDPHAGRTIASLVLANLCTVIGFGVLSFARLPVLHGIGATVAIGAFLSLVFAAIVAAHGASWRGAVRSS